MPHPCPACGYLTMPEPPGSQQICPICRWQDDEGCLIKALAPSGPNPVSLLKAQENFAAFGATEKRRASFVREPANGDKRDATWRPIDLNVDHFADDGTTIDWPEDARRLCYWRGDYILKR